MRATTIKTMGLCALMGLMACGPQDLGPNGGHGKGDGVAMDGFDFDEPTQTVVTQSMDGQSFEVELVADPWGPPDAKPTNTVVVSLPTAQNWTCTSCEPNGLDLARTEPGEAGLTNYIFVLSEQHAGIDHPVLFQGADATQQPVYFSFTLAVDEAQARSDAYLQRACRLYNSAVDDPDAMAMLQNLIPEDTLLEQAITACDEIAQSGRTPPPGCSGVKPPDRSGFGKRIALTFDDGPKPGATDKILDILDAKGVKGTFFVNGKVSNSSAAKALLDRMVRGGHIVANHTQTHCNSSQQSQASFSAAQVVPTDVVLQNAYIHAGASVPEIKFFRFPYGATNCGINNIVQAAGYQIVGWHIDTADWCFNSTKGGYGNCSSSTFRWVPDQYRMGNAGFIGYTLSQARRNGGGILLMHDVHKFTREVLGGMIDTLRAEGFSFVGLDDANTFPKLNDGIGVGSGTPVQPVVVDHAKAYVGYNCKDQTHRGEGWKDHSMYQCVDKYSAHFAADANGGAHPCKGKLTSKYCDGAANILCCVR